MSKADQLQKPQDPVASKRLCIVTLSCIYLQTHQYQSLVREITTPTLPTFVTSCLALITSKSTSKVLEAPASLVESIFDAFSALMPRHPAIFRPFAGQIRTVTRIYVAPTFSDDRFVPELLKESARSLAVLVHQTAPKNTSGEEWGKSVRELVKEIHGTTDQVFRAVVEDWESTVGYISQPIDVNKELEGGGKSKDDYPGWSGIDAGLDRLTGLLGYLEEHFKHHTATAVTVPLGIIDDLLTRLMSIAPPVSKSGSDHGSMRLHPGISREEREGLWAGLPQVHIGAMDIYAVLIDRLQQGFTSLAQGCIEHITWTFRTDKQDESCRTKAYDLIAKVLPLCGSSLPKTCVDRLTSVLVGVCKELRPEEAKPVSMTQKDSHGKATSNGVTNADNFLKSAPILSSGSSSDSAVISAAKRLLPLFFSHLPQQHVEAYVRAELDRTAILSHHKQAMLASVLNPFLGKNGKSLPSILPHLSRGFPRDAAVEALLRPRQPVIRQSRPVMSAPLEEKIAEDEDLIMSDLVPAAVAADSSKAHTITTIAASTLTSTVETQTTSRNVEIIEATVAVDKPNVWGTQKKVSVDASVGPQIKVQARKHSDHAQTAATAVSTAPLLTSAATTSAVEEDEDSDDESVHLEAGLSESEDEEEE